MYAAMRITRSGVHVAVLVAVLLAYGSYALNVSVDRYSLTYGIGALVALAAALGAALNRLWARPLVWALGVVIVLEWTFISSTIAGTSESIARVNIDSTSSELFLV
jgi:hypothetical protein